MMTSGLRTTERLNAKEGEIPFLASVSNEGLILAVGLELGERCTAVAEPNLATQQIATLLAL